MTRPTVVVLADDLIWASRLEEAVRRAGASPARLSRDAELDVVLEASGLDEPLPAPAGPTARPARATAADPLGRPPSTASPSADPSPASAPGRIGGAVVDLGGRRYDGVAAVARIREARLPVIAVSQHDDQETRRAALDAGASRVFSYDKFFRDGPGLVAGWLAREGGQG